MTKVKKNLAELFLFCLLKWLFWKDAHYFSCFWKTSWLMDMASLNYPNCSILHLLITVLRCKFCSICHWIISRFAYANIGDESLFQCKLKGDISVLIYPTYLQTKFVPAFFNQDNDRNQDINGYRSKRQVS